MCNLSKILLLSLFLSPSAFAQWQLSGEDSNINFISIKNSSIAEVHHFNKMNGSINDAGQVKLMIDLNSVETNIGIRNDRLKTMLFDTSTFSEATVSGFVDIEKVVNLKIGDTYVEPVKLNLSLHGLSHQVNNQVRVTKVSEEKLLVTSLTPIIIDAKDFGLEGGIEELRIIANLPSIDTVVPVTFSLVFE